jgi:UDP-GlcNAc:undecaprenyl-phosphate/decaprenyl-phosphate GlcNAc-1-phosphate transferase
LSRSKNGRKQRLATKAALRPVLQRKRTPMIALSPALSVLPALIAAVVASISLVLLQRPGWLPTAHPNVRSLHHRPVPRGGGLAIWSGWLLGTVWLASPQPWLSPLSLIILVSFWDDRYGLPAWMRLAIQMLAAYAWVWLSNAPVNLVAAVVAIVWMANLFNFMDGSDGLAIAMALFGFGAYAIAGSIAGGGDAPILWALVAAIAPCVVMNFPPAKLFLGDVGAVPLGFVAATFGLSGWYGETWPLWFPVLVFLPFVADASVTLALRLLRGDKIWQAHREHFYQKLVQLGFGHRGTLVLYGALMAGTAASALLALLQAPSSGSALVALWSTVLVLVFAVIEHYWRKRHRI